MEQSGLVAQTADSAEAPVTRALMESMFAALRDDLQTVKHELTTEIKDIRKDVDEVGERVATLENKEVARDTELEALQQETNRSMFSHISKTSRTAHIAITFGSVVWPPMKKLETFSNTCASFSIIFWATPQTQN